MKDKSKNDTIHTLPNINIKNQIKKLNFNNISASSEKIKTLNTLKTSILQEQKFTPTEKIFKLPLKFKQKPKLTSDDAKLINVVKNFKNYDLLNPLSNSSNNLTNITSHLDMYIERLSFLNPTESLIGMSKIKDKFIMKKIQTEINERIHITGNKKKDENIEQSQVLKEFLKKNEYDKYYKIPFDIDVFNPLKYKNDIFHSDDKVKNKLILSVDEQDKSNSNIKKTEKIDIKQILLDVKNKNNDFLNKFENSIKEKTFETRLKKLNEDNEITKTKIVSYFDEIKNLESKIIDKSAEITINEGKIKKLEEDFEEYIKAKRLALLEEKSSVIVIHKEEEDMYFLKDKQEFNNLLTEFKNENLSISNEIEELKKEKQNLRLKIKKMEDEKKEITNEINTIRKELLVHYHEILIEGKDTREFGLSWVIVAIWDLKEEVCLQYLPHFLDSQTISFLFKNSQYLMELRVLDLEISRQREEMKILRQNDIENKAFNQTEDSTFKTQEKKYNFFADGLKDKIKGKLRARHNFKVVTKGEKQNNELNVIRLNSNKSNEEEDNENIQQENNEKKKIYPVMKNYNYKNMKEIENNFLNKHYLGKKTKEVMNNILNLEERKEKINKEILLFKEKEIERITKEFVLNNYDKRFNTNLNEVIRALVGNVLVKEELKKAQMTEKRICDDFKKIEIFNY